MKKVCFYTLGCKVNQYETEAMMEIFKENNYELASIDDICDIYIINTCTVTNLSDRKSRQFISRVRNINPEAIIAAVGCYSQINPDEVSEIEGINVVIGTKNRAKIVDYCEEALITNKLVNKVEDIKYNREFENLSISAQDHMTRAYLKIQEGCSQFCSYCIIPYARGPIRSRNIDDIYYEANKLSNNNYKEIILTGIHAASYGLDLKTGISLVDIVEKVATIDGIKRIRLSSLEPRLINRNFLERVRNTGKFCDHFHLSLQSGSDKILKLMNRKYTREEYINKIELIREYFPQAGITTDIIVGFPGETDDDFNTTVDLVRKVEFSKIHIFKYSPREGTVAATMNNQIDGNIKKIRSAFLLDVSDKIAKNFLNSFNGKELEVLFEEKNDKHIMSGYSKNYIRVNTSYDKKYINNITKVKIIDIQDDEVFGII